MKTLAAILFSFLANSAFATEVELVWRRIDTQYVFKDQNKGCTTKTSAPNSHVPGQAYLALELEDGKISAARFSNFPNVWPYKWIYKAIDLTASEIASIELFRDKKKQYWVKDLMLSERLAKWLIYFPSQDHFWCKIPFIPKSLTPSSAKIPFETEGLEMGIEVSYGEWTKFEGESPDGSRFEETIRLVQRKAAE